MSDPLSTQSRLLPVHFLGTGSYVPERIMPNSELESMVDTSDHWIVTRTGLRERRLAADDQATSDLASAAAVRALRDAGVTPGEVDLILVGTSTPDMLFPSTACFVQKEIGAQNATCMDIEAACSGFLYTMEVGRQFVQSGARKRVLVIGAEKMSSVTDWKDRSTCILFGDAAGAAVLGAGSGRGIIHTVTGSDGTLADLLKIPGGGSRNPTTAENVNDRQQYIKMEGQEVFKRAVANMTGSARQLLDESGLAMKDVRAIIPHQANARIIKAVGQRLGASQDQVYINVDKYGNTSAASVIVALDEAAREGFVEAGDVIMFVVFGAGFTWGASLVEWGTGQ
jgi:3-oxoacyl-[acyl-carrier-protein] synthase-3